MPIRFRLGVLVVFACALAARPLAADAAVASAEPTTLNEIVAALNVIKVSSPSIPRPLTLRSSARRAMRSVSLSSQHWVSHYGTNDMEGRMLPYFGASV
jgi:hypothetical protein